MMAIAYRHIVTLVFVFAFHLQLSSCVSCDVVVGQLKVERRSERGVAVGTTRPRFSWQLAATDPSATNISQEAYQMQVFPGNGPSANVSVWDSGKVAGSSTLEVTYNGAALLSSQLLRWRLRVWSSSTNGSGTTQSCESDWSDWSTFRIGRLNASDWEGQWIAQPGAAVPNPTNSCAFYDDRPNSLFRTVFQLSETDQSNIADAVLHIAGLGFFEAFFNGEKVGSSVLAPGFTSFNKRVLFSTFDLTPHFLSAESTEHVLAVALGNGWWNPLPLLFWGHLNLRDHLTVGTRPIVKLDLEVTFNNGTRQTFASTTAGEGSNWLTAGGPLFRNDIYLGVKYDVGRELELTGWKNETAFNASTWKVPEDAEVDANVLGPLMPETSQPVRVTATHAGTLIFNSSTRQVWDFGRNFAGGVKVVFAASGHSGETVSMTYGEILQPNGSAVNPLTSTAGQIKGGTGGPCAPEYAFQRDFVTFGASESDGSATYEPQFTWHAFRFMQIDSDTNAELPPVLSASGFALRSDVAPASFLHIDEQSAPLLNDIWNMCMQTHSANMMSIQSDCPHRERFGYTGDLLATAETALVGFDVSSFYAKRVYDMLDAQRSPGGITETAPFVGISDAGLGSDSGPIGWDSAFLPLQLYLFDYYGDRRVMHEMYNASAAWIDFLLQVPEDLIENGLSDWMSTEPSPKALTGQAFLWLNLWAWSRINYILGFVAVAQDFESRALATARKLDNTFLDSETGVYAQPGQFNATQCAQSMPLYYNITNASVVSDALQVLVSNVRHGSNYTLQTGMFCAKYCLQVLSEGGFIDEAFAMVNTTQQPSYGFMIERGATTLWESWFESNDTYSHNHPMFSSVAVWMVKSLAGVRQMGHTWDSTTDVETESAFAHVVLQPLIPRGLGGLNYSFDTPRGRLHSNWTVAPPYTRPATFSWDVELPVNSRATIFLPQNDASFDVGSGKYHFSTTLE